jgi:hypothetical protein
MPREAWEAFDVAHRGACATAGPVFVEVTSITRHV